MAVRTVRLTSGKYSLSGIGNYRKLLLKTTIPTRDKEERMVAHAIVIGGFLTKATEGLLRFSCYIQIVKMET